MFYLRPTVYLYIAFCFFTQEIANVKLSSGLYNANKRIEELSRTRFGVINNAFVCYSASNKKRLINMLEE